MDFTLCCASNDINRWITPKIKNLLLRLVQAEVDPKRIRMAVNNWQEPHLMIISYPSRHSPGLSALLNKIRADKGNRVDIVIGTNITCSVTKQVLALYPEPGYKAN